MYATFYYRSKLLQAGAFKEAIELAITHALGNAEAQITVTYPRHTVRTGLRDDIKLGVESLNSVIDLYKVDLNVEAILSSPSYNRVSIFYESLPVGVIRTYGSGEASVQCLERVALHLGLEETEEPKDESDLVLETLASRVLALENSVKEVREKLKCFISFKFDDADTVTKVDRLKRLLAGLQIEWVTGEQFEPRRIEDKVKARLRADVDFVIALVSKAGESKWIRDELSDANSRGLWIVLLLEDGANFDKGIFGALEYISYDLTIEQTFPAVIEGINFIKAEISTRVEHHKK